MPTNSNYKFFYLRCSNCKTIISSHEYVHIGTMINKLFRYFGIQ